jgi:PilZ domain
MSKVSNERSEVRYNCLVPIEGKEGSQFDQTRTQDISRHGIGLISSQNVAVNQKIALEIVLKPNAEPVMVIGVVKWVRKLGNSDQYRVGMAFSEVISGSPGRLDKYLTSTRFEA